MNLLNDFAQYGLKTCESWTPASTFQNLYRALVCGSPLPPSGPQQLLVDTGLIHLMIVSGAHLSFLSRALERLPTPWRLCLLCVYTWLTGFGAPVVRAFTIVVLQCLAFRRGLSRLQVDFLATFFLLLAIPEWWTSRSFLMSWMCSLALSLPLLFVPLRAFVFLYPFAPASPLVILWNAVITPIVGNLLFPACLICFVIHGLTGVVDMGWSVFLKILELGPKSPPETWFLKTRSLFFLPLFTHILLMTGETLWRRRFGFLSS